jgi:hypothetical protein
MYEIFLPRDVGQWTGSVGGIENAIVKTEMRDAVDKILAKGAFVWAVFDSCHSATMVRGVGTKVRYRFVKPEVLGIPQATMDAAEQNAPKTRGVPSAQDTSIIASNAKLGAGGSVFFYAAQTRETTPEMILPEGLTEGKSYGLFGFTVMEALETGTPMTYRQMAQYILTRYGAMNETRVTPLFAGTALDQPVLFQDSPLVQQWKIEQGQGLVVLAGALSRLNEGAIVAVMADPSAKTEAAIGYLKLTKVDLSTSNAIPVEYNGKPAFPIGDVPLRSFARMVQNPPQYALRVSVNAKDCGKHCVPKEVIDELRNSKTVVAGTDIKWVDAPASGDVMLELFPDRILFLPPSMQGVDCIKLESTCKQSSAIKLDSKSPSVNEDLRNKLSESLHEIAKTTNLLRIAANLAGESAKNSKLEIALKFITNNGKEISYTKGSVPTLHKGDRISVSLSNNGLKSVDVTMLYVDARYGINVLFPGGAGASNRLESRAKVDFDIEVTDDTQGMERILAIAVEAAKTQERADFSFLAQSPLDASRDIKKRGAIDGDIMAFMDAGFSSYKSRGVIDSPKAPSSRTSMEVFTLNIAQ